MTVAELRKAYGLTENHLTNDIAPIKEVSSTDDAFFDAEKKTRFPLGYEGLNPKQPYEKLILLII